MTHPFTVGQHRAIYLWAGSGTIRMNRLKFMNAPVDEAVHREAHTPAGAQRVVHDAGCNWIYLTYNWGFPPEVEREDWEDFRRAAESYHAAGARVFAYIQTSNYVHAGSFRDKTWQALDPRGRPLYYYTGRYMTCWLHPEWREHLRAMVRGTLEAGTDGVFFDNPWHAGQPLLMAGTWLGAAGCYCPRCRAAFRAAAGRDIPTTLAPETDETSRQYLRWRAEQVTQLLAELAGYARELKPGVVVSANDYDVVMRASTLIHGIDLAALARVQDVLMIEDFALPRWEPAAGGRPAELVNNALTLRTARALAGGTPISVDPYDRGIGFDGVYSPRRFQQGIAEAAALGAPMVVKGTEFVEGDTFTLLTASAYAPQREAIGRYHRWLEAHAARHAGYESAAEVGLLHPGEALWHRWSQLAPCFFGAGQALLAAGIPWRVVAAPEQADGLQALLIFNAEPAPAAVARTVRVPAVPGWELAAPAWLGRHARPRALAGAVAVELFRAYFSSRAARWLLDYAGLAGKFLQSPFFRVPPDAACRALLDAIGPVPGPRLQAAAPALIEWWRENHGNREQVRLVNYAPAPQPVTVCFDRPVAGTTFSPGAADVPFAAGRVTLPLDIYAVVEFRNA